MQGAAQIIAPEHTLQLLPAGILVSDEYASGPWGICDRAETIPNGFKSKMGNSLGPRAWTYPRIRLLVSRQQHAFCVGNTDQIPSPRYVILFD